MTTLEEARAVIAAHDEEQTRQKIADAAQYVGKFFKYKNRYSSGGWWWLYVAVTGVDDTGWLSGWAFQHTSSGILQMETQRMFISIASDYKEITGREFGLATVRFMDAVRARIET